MNSANHTATSVPTAAPDPATYVLFGIPFSDVTFAEAVAWVRQRVAARRPAYIATANMDFVMQAWRDPEMQRILLEADLCVADGIPIVWMSRLFGPRLRQRVTGSDLVPMLAEMARDCDYSLFHLGGAPGVAEKSAQALQQRYPGLRVTGCYAPPMAELLHMNHAEILARLAAAEPDILYIAFGAPKQEKFAAMHVGQWRVPVAMGVGGSLDFLAGTQQRAPRLVQKLALEWLWRMLTNPRRLMKRYLGNLVFFFAACLRLLAIRAGRDRAAGGWPDGELAGRWPAQVARFQNLRTAAAAAEFLRALEPAARRQCVVLDLRGVAQLSSLDLGALVRLAKTSRVACHRLFLAGAGSRVRQFVRASRLTEYLDLPATPAELETSLRALDAAARDGEVRRAADGLVLIRTPADLTAANLGDFRWRVEQALEKSDGTRAWIVDAGATRFMDSSALSFLVGLKKRAAADRTKISFRNFQPAVRRTLCIARLDQVLDPA